MSLNKGLIAFSLTVLTTLFPARAKAEPKAEGYLLFPSFTYEQESGDSTGRRGNWYGDARIGYKASSGLVFGLIFTRASGTGSDGYSMSQGGFGNFAGFIRGSFGAMLNYFFTHSRMEQAIGTRVERSEGSGFQVDLTYTLPVTDYFLVGPVLSYRSILYRKVQIDGGQLDAQHHTHTQFFPYIGLLLIF